MPRLISHYFLKQQREDSNMATQIRKFEQEAIVESIFKQVNSGIKKKANDFAMSDETYKEIISLSNKIKGIQTETKLLDEKRSKIKTQVRHLVDEFNSKSPSDKYKKLNDIESSHLKIYRQFFKTYKLDRNSETKVGEWKGSVNAIKTVKDSHRRWLNGAWD